MNETLMLVLECAAGGGARRRILRGTLVDGSQGCFVQAAGALVLRQPAGEDGRCPGWILLCRARALGAAGRVSPWVYPGTPGRDVADAAIGREPKPPGTGGQPCALVPIR